MRHHLNSYYKELQETAERNHRDDMLAWQWQLESENNARTAMMGIKIYAPCEKQPISKKKDKENKERAERSEAWIKLYEKNKSERDDNEFEVHTKP